eukprot:TRINITY_DN10282_c0_g1_i3.p1 TRINITY_DN10282_c0_g1~~TRINITY_DN10282_c0_g1_i3.p1  ORF type:complete len:127 (+),score=8.46 TRINITY_DN10282_c0_g1_i3:244-624(+)
MGQVESRRIVLEREGDGVGISEGVLEEMVQEEQRFRQQQRAREQRPSGSQDEVTINKQEIKQALQKAHDAGFKKGLVQERRNKEHELRQLDIQWQERVDNMNQQVQAGQTICIPARVSTVLMQRAS